VGLLTVNRVFSATNSSGPDEIPPLHPPHAEIPPTFWEQYGQWVIVGCIILLVALAFAIWFLTRPRPPIIGPPEVTARKALAALQGQPEDGAVLSRVSQAIRRYVAAAFGMPPEELNTTEFCRSVEDHEQIGSALSAALAEFLRRCDERKFAPSPPAPALGAVARGFELIELAETRRAQLRAAAAATAPQPLEKPPLKT